MATAEQIKNLYADSGYPSSQIFFNKLKRMGIPARLKDIQEFVKSQSSRQVAAPGPKFLGKIVSFDINHKWAADVISFVSRPVKNNDGPWSYVLIVQDIFSRKIYTRAMRELSQVTSMFEDILQESQLFDSDGTNEFTEHLTTDNGTEFTNENFKTLCRKYNIEQSFKTPGTHDIATIDRAIGVWKKIVQRISNAQGGNWYTLMEKATDIYNSTENSMTKAQPDEVAENPVKRFDMQVQASINIAHNTKLIRKRKEKLQQMGSFRIHQPNTKVTGLGQRIDTNLWSKEIFKVSNFPKPGYVEDEHQRAYPTKLVLPISGDSSRLTFESEDSLRPFAVRLREMLIDGNMFTTIKLTQAGKDMKKILNFTETLKKRKLYFKQFVQRFPDLLRIENNMIFPA